MSKDHDTFDSLKQRLVRVFISSTFQDMHAERNELVKYVFPELRRRYRERRVEFVDVDLRWGVTEKQAERGEVLPICLAEIERCHPYFIGILGERYGWVPEHIDEELIQLQPWLAKHQEQSITELEICHGVLNDEKMQGLAYFYLRDPKTSKHIETDLAKKPNYRPEPAAAKDKLDALKERINKSSYSVTENYTNAETVGKKILDDLWAAIDKRFPESETPSALEQERLEHEAFAAARTKVYIGREEYFGMLDEHINGDGLPLVLLGESGSGKSALLANWAYRYREKHPDDFMLLHFVGGTPDSADYVQLLRRIMLEIKERYEPEQKSIDDTSDNIIPFKREDEEDSIPTDPQKLIETFPKWFAKAAAKGKFILILDGLNQLEDRDNAPDLTWLPQFTPPNIRLIVSTLPGRSLQALQKRDWPNLTIEALNTKERSTFIPEYLKQFSKSLDAKQIEIITTAPQTTNPLYLKTLLDELRVFGIHEKLNERIEYYLQANTIDALFDKMLARLEQDYERNHPGLTKQVMSLIWASRHGLSESELLELLNIPQVIWSPLYLAIEESLVSRSGLLSFFHDFLRQAVENRYLQDTVAKQKTHLCLADYFQKRELDDRQVNELPWQLRQTESWERLKDCIAAPAMFLRLFTEQKQYELTSYWLAIGDRFDMVEAYHAAIKKHESECSDKGDMAILVNLAGQFLDLNARYEGAEPLMCWVVQIYEAALGPDHPGVATGLNNLAGLLDKTNRHGEAEPLYRRALQIDEAAFGPDHPKVATVLNNLAELLSATNRHSEAEPLMRRALQIDEAALGPDHPGVTTELNNLAVLLSTTNRHSEAESRLNLWNQNLMLWI